MSQVAFVDLDDDPGGVDYLYGGPSDAYRKDPRTCCGRRVTRSGCLFITSLVLFILTAIGVGSLFIAATTAPTDGPFGCPDEDTPTPRMPAPAVLSVVFPSGEQTGFACGDALALGVVRDEPTLTFAQAEAGEVYSVMMLDIDHPFAFVPFLAPYRSWFVSNVPGESLRNGTLTGGTVVHKYDRPAPGPRTGSHTYDVLVFKQPRAGMVFADDHRIRFDLADWASEYGVEQQPAALTAFEAEDSSARLIIGASVLFIVLVSMCCVAQCGRKCIRDKNLSMVQVR